MSKHLSIEFVGTYSNLLKFFETKGWTFEIKKISTQKIFVTVPEDLIDEVKFFESPADDTSETRMTKVNIITFDEYANTIENGFEIVNDESKVVTESTVTPSVFPSETEVKSQVTEIITKVVSVNNGSEEVNDSVAKALSDAVLPSKSPLDNEDPFSYMTSRRYLTNFALASSVLLFVVALLD